MNNSIVTFIKTGLLVALVISPLSTVAQMTLGEVLQQLHTGPVTADQDKLYQSGIDRLQQMSASSLQEDLEFLTLTAQLMNNEPKVATLVGLLREKYKEDLLSRLNLLRKAAVIYQDQFGRDEEAEKFLQEARSLSEEFESQLALSKLELHMQYAELLLRVADPEKQEMAKERALKELVAVAEFSLFDDVYLSRLDQLKALYTQAVLRIVEISEPRDLRQLSVYPFAYEEISKHYPRKIGQLSGSPPGVAELQEKIAVWLKLSAENEPEGSDIRAQFEAVLQHMNRQ